MDLKNLPCTCLCHRKHDFILHMVEHFTKYLWPYPLKNKQAGCIGMHVSILVAIWIP